MLYVEPQAGPAPIVQVIGNARRTVDLNVYYLSSRPILQALRAAVERGVRVKVILDGHPYGMKPWQIRREFREAQVTGAGVKAAPRRFEANFRDGRYVFDHAKYVCNGHECEIGTANFDWSAFNRNREYLTVIHSPERVRALRAVFHADWSGRPAGAAAHRALVLSPGAEPELAALIRQPGPVDIESEEMGDDRAILDAIEAKGREARVILPASVSAQDRRNVQRLEAHSVEVRYLPARPLYLHAKMIVGKGQAFIGSENFTTSSLDHNREAGLVMEKPGALDALRSQFDADWQASRSMDAARRHDTWRYRHG